MNGISWGVRMEETEILLIVYAVRFYAGYESSGWHLTLGAESSCPGTSGKN